MGVSHGYRAPRVGGRVVAQRHTGDIVNRHRGHGAEQDKIREPGGCAAFGPQLEAYYYHALEPQQAQSVAEHAAGCALCRATLERFAATDQLIAAAPIALPGPELRQRLAARIATARADRSTGAATPVPIERTTVVQDMNDVNDSPWTTTETQTRQTGRHWQRMRVLLGTVAAVLSGGPAGGGLADAATWASRRPGDEHPNAHNGQPDDADDRSHPVCDKRSIHEASRSLQPSEHIKAHLPAHALLFDLAMVSPEEGWAVGAIEDAGNGDPVGSLILHYINCAWTP